MRLIDTSGGGARTRENPALAGRGRLELRELGEADRAAIEAHFLTGAPRRECPVHARQ